MKRHKKGPQKAPKRLYKVLKAQKGPQKGPKKAPKSVQKGLNAADWKTDYTFVIVSKRSSIAPYLGTNISQWHFIGSSVQGHVWVNARVVQNIEMEIRDNRYWQ